MDLARELQQVPKYRVVGEGVPVNGIFHPSGTTYSARQWPIWPLSLTGRLVGENLPARRILSFIDKFKFGYPVVKSLWNDEYGRYWLPEPGDDYRSSMIRALPETNLLPKMPLYRALRTFDDSHLVPNRPFPNRIVNKGDTIAVLTWPSRLAHHEFEPANAQAEEVWEYYDRHSEHPNIEPSPWCWFHLDIWLKELVHLRESEAA